MPGLEKVLDAMPDSLTSLRSRGAELGSNWRVDVLGFRVNVDP